MNRHPEYYLVFTIETPGWFYKSKTDFACLENKGFHRMGH